MMVLLQTNKIAEHFHKWSITKSGFLIPCHLGDFILLCCFKTQYREVVDYRGNKVNSNFVLRVFLSQVYFWRELTVYWTHPYSHKDFRGYVWKISAR